MLTRVGLSRHHVHRWLTIGGYYENDSILQVDCRLVQPTSTTLARPLHYILSDEGLERRDEYIAVGFRHATRLVHHLMQVTNTSEVKQRTYHRPTSSSM